MSDWRLLEGGLAAWSRGDGPRLVFAHGFTQTSNSWKPIAEQFVANGYESVVVDLPGHGASTNGDVYLRDAAQMLVEMCGEAVYVGYSLGGRLCLHAAATKAGVVQGLALIGASPGIADEGERASRRAADDRMADHIVEIGVDAFLDDWLARPLFAALTVDPEARADRTRNTPQGLAASLRHAGTGAQDSLWPCLGELAMPVLAIAGELDTKFAEIGRRIADAVRDGRFVEVPAAGHAAHLQSPQHLADILKGWLAEISY
jgi:2-succinyl-6-hydroxy-2,4-cyclohexadiene-1-carboxylate synthase